MWNVYKTMIVIHFIIVPATNALEINARIIRIKKLVQLILDVSM